MAISPSLAAQFSQYFDPSAFNIPSNAGYQGGGNGGLSMSSFQPSFTNPNPAYSVTSGLLGSDVAGAIDPIGGLFGSLFGGGGPSWKPYVDKSGNYVWNDPHHANPVPVTSVPGATLKPNKTYRQSADNLSAMEALFPSLANLIAGQMIPQQQAALAAAQATSDPYAQLMTDLYKKFAPQLAGLGNDVNRTTMMGTAQNQADVLKGPGKDLTSAANALLQQTNPEYYKQRAGTSNQLDQLYSSIDNMMNGGLSTTENREISQGLAQEGNQRGTTNAPSNVATVGNAMRYGQAGTARTLASQSNLTSAIQAANQFLPQSQVAFNPIAQATGMNMNNPGSNQFTGINNGAQNAYGTISGMANGLGSNVNALQQQNNEINQQNKQANSWQNVFGTITSGIGSILSGVGGLAGI
jgi:hypothetical protein